MESFPTYEEHHEMIDFLRFLWPSSKLWGVLTPPNWRAI